MILNNENKKLSRSRKNRIEGKIKMDDKIKPLLNKIKQQRKKRRN